MAHPILLQDWITARGNTGATIVSQQESSYADLKGYLDVAIHLQVADFSASSNLDIQTSPTKEEGFFRTMLGFPISSAAVFFGVSRYASAAIPLTRWVRWQLTGVGVPPVLTFRIWLVGNPACSVRSPDDLLPDWTGDRSLGRVPRQLEAGAQHGRSPGAGLAPRVGTGRRRQ